MKTKYTLVTAVLTIALTLPMLGQDTRSDTIKADVKQSTLSGMMGKPNVDTTVGGIQMKVWLMTQDQHRDMMKEKKAQMMTQAETEGDMRPMEMTGIDHSKMPTAKDVKGMPHDSVGEKAASLGTGNDTVDAIQGSRSMNKATMDSMTAGTHHIMLDVTERASGQEIAGASARLLIESPSKKSSTVELKSMMKHFGSALTLDEKGEYRFTVNVSVGGVTKTTQFQYAAK